MKKKEQGRVTSIKVKLLGIILPVVIIIMVVLVGISYLISKRIITGYSQDLLRSSIENQANQIEAWMNENLSAFQMVKHIIEETSPDQARLQGILNSSCGFHDNYPQGMYIADEYGKLLKAAASVKTEPDPRASEWYKSGLTRWNMGFTKAYRNETDQAVISASGILDDKTGVMKVISADLTLERISIIVNSFIEMDQARAFLVDSTDGTILAHQDQELIFQNLSGSGDKFLEDIGGKIEASDFTMMEIDENMTAFQQIQGMDWILVSYIPTNIIYADLNQVRLVMMLIGLISVLLLAVLVERVVHLVIRPVKKLTKAITAMTDGDFTIEVSTKNRDEIGVMSRYVERFIVSMRQMIQAIHDVSDKLKVQADNSDEVSEQMYDASKLQGRSMRELNQTVEQLSISVNEIADHATTLAMVVSETKENGNAVNDKMQETVTVSKRGKEDIQRVSEAMEDIHASMQKLQEAIDKVGKTSGEISNIAGMIGDIADQTNLLSLNASIEAARAGDAGRGFAVVATEIGQLASTSANAVHDIENLSGEINSLVKDTVKQTGESVDSINRSGSLVGDVLKTFDAIFDNIEKVNQLVQEMIQKVDQVDGVATNAAAISQEQAASSEEILSASETMVEQVDHITGNSEQVSEGAKELKVSAEELYGQVAKFKIREEEVQ